ncbi:MAG: sigma-54-dependent Fis family transcriptional regulator, partial [Methylophilales bacterium]|nr:sigma-54-dependent Fis family transcriptional regulator [Methylophilales bacterium]
MNKSKILVVDDEKDIRESLSDILNDEGFEVFIAENAIKAKEIKNNTNLDLILLDIWMPECDGISLLKEWAINKQINCPVIMMSGHGTIDTAIEATRIGAYDFIEKPISLQKLLKKVSIALKKSIRIDGLDLSFISQGDDPLIKELRQKLSNLKKNNLICISGHEGNFTNLCIEYIVGNNFYLFDPQQKLEATIVNRIQGKGQSLILIKNYTNLTAYGIAELKNIIDVLTVNKIRVVIVDNRKNFILALLKDMVTKDHFFTLPIDN